MHARVFARLFTVLATVLATAAAVFATPVAAEAGPRIDNRYFGVVDPSNANGEFPEVKVGSVSLMGSSYWPDLEPHPGEFDFTQLDAQVATVQRNKARPMLVLGFTPRFHSTRSGAEARTSMPRMRAWKRYVRTVAQRYGTRIDYQIWPEPNIRSNWTGTPRQLAILQRAAYLEIKRVAPKAVVAGPAFVLRLRGQQRWMRLFYNQKFNRKPIGRWLDVVPLDPYPPKSGAPEHSAKYVRIGRNIARAAGARKPIWSVEINYGIAGGAQPVRPFPQAKQISYLIRTYALHASTGVKRVFWLGWGHYRTLGISLTEPDGRTVSPTGMALGRVRNWMLGYRHQGCTKARTGVWTCTLVGRTAGRGETRRIMWRASGKRYVRAPRRSFKYEAGTGGSKRLRPGQRVKITSMPRLIRARR